MTIQYDSNGIITQNLTEIINERETNLQPVMGEDFAVDKTTPIGNMELADSNNELTIQELIAWLFPNQMDANTAEGIFLDAICEKNRIYRYQPAYTTFNLILTGTPKTQFYSGDITISDKVSGYYYDLNEDATIGEDGKVSAQFKCEDFGENYIQSNSSIEIETPVVGLDSITLDEANPNIVLGRLTETDEELRRRRMYSVQQTATTTLGSISANLYSTAGVQHVTYFENDTEETDSNGLPMKSFEFVVDGGDENDITDKIFLNKPVGTRAYGTTLIQKSDSEGNLYQIGYTKVKNINIGIKIVLTVGSAQSSTWEDKVKQALKDKFDGIQDIGTLVKDYNYYTVLTNFSDITDITSILFYDVDNPQGDKAQYSIGRKEIAKLDVKNISITTSIGK